MDIPHCHESMAKRSVCHSFFTRLLMVRTMQRGARSVAQRGVKFVFEEDRVVSTNLCSMMCESPNTKVHGVLTMLSPMKPRKFDAIIGTFVPVSSYHFTIITHCTHCSCFSVC